MPTFQQVMIARARDYGKHEIPNTHDWLEAQFLAYYGKWDFISYRKTPKHLIDKVLVLLEVENAFNEYQAKKARKKD